MKRLGPPTLQPSARQRILGSVWLPINEAALCLDLKCSAVFRLGEDACPACGGTHHATLSKWLDENRRKR